MIDGVPYPMTDRDDAIRNAYDRRNPDTVATSINVEEVHAPEGMVRCCHGFYTAVLELLDDYQKAPCGTHAWAKSYRRRARIEGLNKVLKIDEGARSPSGVG